MIDQEKLYDVESSVNSFSEYLFSSLELSNPNVLKQLNIKRVSDNNDIDYSVRDQTNLSKLLLSNRVLVDGIRGLLICYVL